MKKTLTLTLVCLLTLAFSGCKKKPKDQDKAKGGTDSMSMDAPAGGMGGDMAARPAGGAKSAAAACKKGARPDKAVEKPEYKLTIKVPASAKVGETVKAEIRVSPKAGYKVNLKYPTELVLKTATGVDLPKKKFEKGQAAKLTKEELVYQVDLKAKAAGKGVVAGELGFSVCTPKLCITEPDMCVAWEVTGK